MRHSFTLPSTLLLSGLAVAAIPLSAEGVLKSSDHLKIGKQIAAYWEAQKEGKDIQDAFEDVRKAFDLAQKKAGKKVPSGSLLSSVEDWEAIFYHANGYSDRGVKKGRVEERTYEDEWFGDYELAISTPKKYSSKKGPYPTVLCIPPKGKKAKEHLLEDWVDSAAREEFILVSFNMPGNERLWAERGSRENHGGIDTAMLSLKSVKLSHAVDVDRVFLAGFGEGVDAAMRIAALFPHVFAGVLGRAGDISGMAATNFRNLPTFFAGGGEKCTAFQAGAKEAGIENVRVEAAATEADLWEWMRAGGRHANPVEVSLAPTHLNNRQAYWLTISGFELDSGPQVHARIDRENNTIHIDGEGVATVTVYFNDLLVDLSKAVTVVCNGLENEDYIPPNLKTMIDIAYSSGDSGRVYVGSHTYDLPQGATEE